MRVLLSSFRLIVLLVVWLPSTAVRAAEPTVILVSLDAFRWDYLDRYAAEAPRLRQLAAGGVRVERLVPSFPSLTYPNHYTLATGLRPEHHGLVANTMFDPANGASFSLKDSAEHPDPQWWGGEPIWNTAEKQGVRTACMFWPGSDVPIAGRRPSWWSKYEHTFPVAQRVDRVLGWLDLPPAERPRLILAYFSDADDAGHKFGPDSPEVAAAVRTLDTLIGRLADGIAARKLAGEVDLVVMSDHGMTATGAERVIVLDDHVSPEEVRIDFSGAVTGLRPKTDTPAALLAKLKAMPHVQVLAREAMPERWHFRDHRRIPPVLIVADEGWRVTTREQLAKGEGRVTRGMHGFDPAVPAMGAMLVANGPAFRRGVTIPAGENVDVYNLVCAILGLHPAPNDGGDALAKAALAGR